MILSSAFLLSSISKVISPGYFEITLVDQGLLASRELAAYATRIFVIIELALGLLLLQNNYYKKIILPATGILLTIFSFYLLFLSIQGDDQNCGCFSSMIEMNPIEALIKNLILLALLLYSYRMSKQKDSKILLPIAIVLTSTILVYFNSPIRSHDEFPFASFTKFSKVERIDLAEGDNLVAVFDATCEHCMETAKTINRIMEEVKIFPDIYVLMLGENSEDIKSFYDQTNTEFPTANISVDEFFDLIGNSPPRIYYLKSGVVEAIWDENIEETLWDKFANKDNPILQFNFDE